MVSDHTGSDRNNDGWDSPKILNDLMSNNSVDSTDPFGFSIDLLNIASENPNVIGSAAGSDPIIRGPFGTATGTIIRNGTTVTLKPADNAGVRGEIFRSGFSASGTTGAAVATSTFGSGRVMFWGDSSPIDDGTGQSGNTLFNGWNDPAGTDATVALNGTEWLASGSTGGGTGSCSAPGQKLGNPGFESGNTVWSAASGVITSSTSEAAHSGSWKAWLDGYGTTHTDTLSQSATIPAGCSATLSFYLHIDSAETTTTTAYDKLTVKAGSTTLATYSNLNKGTGYTLRSFNVSVAGRPDRVDQLHRSRGQHPADLLRDRRCRIDCKLTRPLRRPERSPGDSGVIEIFGASMHRILAIAGHHSNGADAYRMGLCIVTVFGRLGSVNESRTWGRGTPRHDGGRAMYAMHASGPEPVEHRAGGAELRKLLLAGLVDRLPAAIYAAESGPDGQWLYASPQIKEILGFGAEDLIADPGLWARQLHPDDRRLGAALGDRRRPAPAAARWSTG